ncbi:hypothetical protein [Clostridium neonatale]|uniref:Uncharacterized protein n=1 Tax=Clostridium neonatale TaxID=137838 RepID=A0AA86JC92_9CLOT|nr:hypothetical protein [Clostridium neonatale]MBP8314158.1 hypothetical protein [Clostridium neonatale]CAG9701496.1 hypothetical protein CNEO_10030 [Clostridium neonatale]CAG9714302.1 hypothetical protein CNEO_2330005 [Clostridium neonatale]CAI3193579.1 hypothetical protein CNEO2_1280004 [Clostridium neonatale]CAI3194996.1 hypothetical protein CNEO2_1320009 [Clostridium neonatale]
MDIFGKSAKISLIEDESVLKKLKSYLEYNANNIISSNELANKLNIVLTDAKK